MGDESESGAPSITLIQKKKFKLQQISAQMNQDELKINKPILEEITKRKKERIGLSNDSLSS